MLYNIGEGRSHQPLYNVISVDDGSKVDILRYVIPVSEWRQKVIVMSAVFCVITYVPWTVRPCLFFPFFCFLCYLYKGE